MEWKPTNAHLIKKMDGRHACRELRFPMAHKAVRESMTHPNNGWHVPKACRNLVHRQRPKHSLEYALVIATDKTVRKCKVPESDWSAFDATNFLFREPLISWADVTGIVLVNDTGNLALTERQIVKVEGHDDATYTTAWKMKHLHLNGMQRATMVDNHATDNFNQWQKEIYRSKHEPITLAAVRENCRPVLESAYAKLKALAVSQWFTNLFYIAIDNAILEYEGIQNRIPTPPLPKELK